MTCLRLAAATAFLTIIALPAAAGALEASGIALAGFAECARGASKAAGDSVEATAPSAEAVQTAGEVAAAAETWLRDYLEFHALAQEDNAARMALMPWPALRTHAN